MFDVVFPNASKATEQSNSTVVSELWNQHCGDKL